MLGILKGLGQKQGRSEQPSTFRRSLRRAAHSRRHRKAGAGSECDKRIETEFADVAAQPIIQLVGSRAVQGIRCGYTHSEPRLNLIFGIAPVVIGSYAAHAYGHPTGRPGAYIVVTGPGVVHGLAGLADAQQNCWPMILIGGASETYRGGMGAFQEERQVVIAAPLCKFAHAIDRVARIPYYVEMATRNAIYGRPGATYLDMPDDIITGKVDEDKVVQVERAPDPPRTVAPQEYIEDALNLLEKAERPLVLVGKGMAWSRAEDEVRAFLERTQIPFLRSPMGKGVVPDDHPLSVAAARTLALQNADVVFLMGVRFNWIFHPGLSPGQASARRRAMPRI